MSERYNLPADTALRVNDHVAKCKNLSLILDKYPPQPVVADIKNKGLWLQDLIKGHHIDAALAQSAYDRWYAMVSGMEATLFHAALDWRMVIGLGGEGVLETDITLHHLYGFPFIPASALKGLTRTYLTGEIDGYKSKKSDDDNEEVKRIFGSQEQAGTVIFFDAMPIGGKVAFSLDIMNSHYPEYYGGSKPPTNDQNPIPITFLTVTDTTFTFALAPRKANKEGNIRDVKGVKTWLQEALQKYGIGSKTSAGYGYFKEAISSIKFPPLEKIQGPYRPAEHIRPKVPQIRSGQEIKGVVVPLTEELHERVPSNTKAVLRYESFSTTEVMMAVSEEEAKNWKAGETRICVFEREQKYNDLLIWVCNPRVKKDKDGKK